MAPTKAFAQVRLFVNEYFCGDDIAKGHEHLHEVLVTKLLRQVVDEQVGSIGTCQTQQRSRSVLTWRSIKSSGLLKVLYTLLPWQTSSIEHHLNCSGNQSAILQLMCKGCSYKYPPLSIARYSFMQLSELEQCRVNKLAQGFTRSTEFEPGWSQPRVWSSTPFIYTYCNCGQNMSDLKFYSSCVTFYIDCLISTPMWLRYLQYLQRYHRLVKWPFSLFWLWPWTQISLSPNVNRHNYTCNCSESWLTSYNLLSACQRVSLQQLAATARLLQLSMRMHSEKMLKNKSNNNDEFLCANILEGGVTKPRDEALS